MQHIHLLLSLFIASHAFAAIDLSDSMRPSPIKSLDSGDVEILGRVELPDGSSIRIRVATSLGFSSETSAKVSDGKFRCRYPKDFPATPVLVPSLLYVDATDEKGIEHQSEAVLIVSGGRDALPDLPLVFTDDFIDAAGNKDQACAQWIRNRFLINHFVSSRAAQLMGIYRPEFDLTREADFRWFKENASLYEFDHRDRDWSQPLGHRVARGFWQAMWNRWFNASNSHPWDGNPANRAATNYRPYTFTNDPADILVLYRMMEGVKPAVADNRRNLADEVQNNLLALQHSSPENFALKEADGRQEYYTAGAFHYGMFETGEWLTEGTGWFANPKFRDFAWGGVLNGRAVWALGEDLKIAPQSKYASQIRDAIALTLRFCLHDGLAHNYTLKTKSGLPVWNRTAGEHAYLLLGMIATCQVAPEMPITYAENSPARPLREITWDALDALTEIAGPEGNWTKYANATAMNIAALAEGVRLFPTHPHAPNWKAAAMKAADFWLALKPLPAERSGTTPMFGHMIQQGGMTFVLGKGEQPHVPLYVGGHWIHALAVLHTVTHEQRYADRAHAIVGYYCGDNPLRVRLLNELGAVNNRVTDSKGSGMEDQIGWDAYPESTAFVQIGLMHLLRQ